MPSGAASVRPNGREGRAEDEQQTLSLEKPRAQFLEICKQERKEEESREKGELRTSKNVKKLQGERVGLKARR